MAVLKWMGALRDARVRRRVDTGLLTPPEFDRVAACERMRTDRNGSPLSILLIALPPTGNQASDVQSLAEVLGQRLRMTDTAGRLRDGRIGVLLPDTAESGAWKVAADLCDVYEVGEARPSCEVLVYPDRDRGRGSGDGDASQPSEPRPPIAVAGAGADFQSADSFFVRSCPAWKRVADIVGASLGLVVAAPVIGAAAVAVAATSPGGAFFVQEREGHGGRRFKIFKLRTMRRGSDRIKHKLRARSEQDGPAFKMTDDPRVTRIGAFLRKTSIDELPQLLNVLRGEMSLVGPRPLQIDESLACEPWQRQRLAVKPGLTCIWQVKGRSVVSFDEWARMDLRYAREADWKTDVKLILQTPPALLLARGPR
ncbi:MAG: sugar transferase [Planctomycetota bacterium]